MPYRELRDSDPELHNVAIDSDVEAGNDLKAHDSPDPSDYAPVISNDTPFFHLDLAAAVSAAESGSEARFQ